MARYERYRDPLTGRFLKREVAESSLLDVLFERQQPGQETERELRRGGRRVTEYGEVAAPNWGEYSTKWGVTWAVGDGTEIPLDPEALEESSMPFGAQAYRIRYFLLEGSPNGSGTKPSDQKYYFGSTDWIYPGVNGEWPPSPDLLPANAQGIAAIHFDTD